MSRRIYLASSWRNRRQANAVLQLRNAGHLVYDFKNPDHSNPDNHGFSWREIAPDWQNWSAEQYRAALDHPIARAGLALDFDAMKWANTFVMVQPCGRSAALELGWGIGAGKRTAIWLAEGQEPELMFALADLVTTDWLALEAWLEKLDGRAKCTMGCE